MSTIQELENKTEQPHKQGQWALTLAALGVVYGDIGTSPLYTMKSIFDFSTGLVPSPENLIGAVSTIFWALMLVVTLKYVLLILRADNNGEGGGLALTALAARAVAANPKLRRVLLLLGVLGATLFYGDSVITPAISVIGAIEGLEVLTVDLAHYVVPVSIVILIGVFVVQRFGTRSVGRFFGPVIVLWFLTLGISGVMQIIKQPTILLALNPLYAFDFLMSQGPLLLIVVGAVVLAITGAEAIYADMGHFGKKPIQVAWVGFVLPCLTLNYMGQGALIMTDVTALENPFYRMFPDYLLIPSLILATCAAVIASQAVISGAYSMTKQAMLLGFLPRMRIIYTSAQQAGQIYIPAVNWLLLIGVLVAVVAFQDSSRLAGAYGVAVTLTMVITTTLTFFVVRAAWKFPLWFSLAVTGFFIAIDIFLFLGCIIKFLDGGWFPLAMSMVLFLLMTTWSRGRVLLLESIRQDGLDWALFLGQMYAEKIPKALRIAIYPVANPEFAPQALLHNLKHNQVLHEKNIILTVCFEEVPVVQESQRCKVYQLSSCFWKVSLHFGFTENPDVPLALGKINKENLLIELDECSYFVSRETVVPTRGYGMIQWRERLFAVMNRNSGGVVEFFNLPDNAVVELGTRVQI